MDLSNLNPQQQAVLGQWLMQQIISQKTVPSSSPNVNFAHGPGGLFSHPALEQPLYSAVIAPWTGLQYVLPVRGTVKTDPLYGIVTGVTATTGSEPVGVCDDPPTAGLLKLCMQWYPLARDSRQTSVIDISRGDRITDRGEHTDFIVYGQPFAWSKEQSAVPGIPSMGFMFGQGAESEVTKRMVEFMTAWSRDFARIIYTGNPTNNTAQGGYKEPFGMDIILNTGHRDAETAQLCPAADPVVRNFGNLNITGAANTANQASLVRLISYIFRNLGQLAAQANLLPVEWVIAMPFGMFYELSEFWPVAYATYRSQQSGTGTTVFVDNMSIENRRDDMRGDMLKRTGQYLLIDGQKIPVVLDDAITETTQANACFSGTMYFVPLRVLGNREATFIEYFDYNQANVLKQAQTMAAADTFSVSDGGRFLIHKKPPTNFCTQLLAVTEWRVVCTTPYLGARITNINYCPLIHERSYDPASNYHQDGGRTSRTGSPSYFSIV